MNFWNNFAAKHPAAAKWVREGGLFVIVSNLITVFKYLLLQFLPKAFASLPVVDFGWPGIDITLFGETFKWNILGYDAAHGGLPYFCAYMVAMVIGECKAYVENFGREKGSILFTGSTGCGKTFLSNCIARELLRQCYSVVYLTATDMFDILSESRFGGRDGEEVRDRAAYILDCDLLIIDDLGTELINTFTASQLFYCINERLTKKLGTIISTNLALSRMQDEFTERVTSRIMSQYKVLPLLGEDLRLLRRGYGKQG